MTLESKEVLQEWQGQLESTQRQVKGATIQTQAVQSLE